MNDTALPPVTHWAAMTGHHDWTLCAAFLPNSQSLCGESALVVSGGIDRHVKLWRAFKPCLQTANEDLDEAGEATEHKHFELLLDVRAHTNWVRTVASNADGSIIASSGDDTVINLLDASSGSAVRDFVSESACVHHLAWRPCHATELLSCGGGTSINLWDARTPSTEAQVKFMRSNDGEPADLRSLIVPEAEFTPSGMLMVSCSFDKTLRVWDVRRSEVELCYRRLPGELKCCTVTRHGSLVLCGGIEGCVKAYDLSPDGILSEDPVAEFNNRVEGEVSTWRAGVLAIKSSLDGSFFISGGSTNEILARDCASRATMALPHSEVNGLGVSQDGSLFASAGADATINVWQVLGSGKMIKSANKT